jgi:hypothetical protein
MPPETEAFLASEAIADEPEHRGPEADEERSPLGISTLVLPDGFRTNPKAYAKSDRAQGGHVEVAASEA